MVRKTFFSSRFPDIPEKQYRKGEEERQFASNTAVLSVGPMLNSAFSNANTHLSKKFSFNVSESPTYSK